jgi:uncharacterized protein YkwD
LELEVVADRPMVIVALATASIALATFVMPRSARAQTAPGANCPDADLLPGAQVVGRVQDALLCVVNAQRVAAGRPPFVRDVRLDSSSAFHGGDMLRYHFFAHRGPDRPPLLNRILASGYFNGANGGMYAENIGEGPQASASASNMVAAWMLSGDHRANILDPRLSDIGIAAVLTGPDPAFYVGDPGVLYVTDFGRRDGATSAAAQRGARCTSRRARRSRRRFCQPRTTPPGTASAASRGGVHA